MSCRVFGQERRNAAEREPRLGSAPQGSLSLFTAVTKNRTARADEGASKINELTASQSWYAPRNMIRLFGGRSGSLGGRGLDTSSGASRDRGSGHEPRTGSKARKSTAGRARTKRRGPRKAGVGEVDEGRLHGARRKTRGRRKLRRGSSGRRSNPSSSATDSREEQGPEGGREILEPVGNCWQGARANDRRAAAGDEPAGASREGKPLESEPWTRQRGETNPQGRKRSKPSRTCETSRAERSGLGMPASVDSSG